MSNGFMPLNEAYLLNTTVDNTQAASTGVPLNDGGYLVFWNSNQGGAAGLDIRAQRIDVDGNPVGDEFSLNGVPDDDQFRPSGTVLSDGTLVVVWAVNDDVDWPDWGIYGRKFAADGTPIGDDFEISPVDTAERNTVPDVTALEDGGYVVTWIRQSQGSFSQEIKAVVYDAHGNVVASEFSIASGSAFQPPAVEPTMDGGFLVITMSGPTLRVARYDDEGSAVGSSTIIGTGGSTAFSGFGSTRLEDGSFVVTYLIPSATPGEPHDLHLQRLDATGQVVGTPVLVDPDPAQVRGDSDVAALADGGYVVTWSVSSISSPYGIYGRRYNADGDPVGDPFEISDSSVFQYSPSVTVSEYGGFTVSWNANDYSVGGFSTEVYARSFASQFYGTDGDDIQTGNAGDNIFMGSAGADVMDGQDGTDTANYEDSAAGVTVSLFHDTATGGDAEGDTLVSIENLTGSDFADVLTGTNHDNTLIGGDGADTLRGLRGDDVLDGGAGDDMLGGHQGDDVVNGGAGADQIWGNGGDDQLFGDGGNDRIAGGWGDDLLSGGDGNDRLAGHRGEDILIGGTGNDRLYGGGGDADTFVFTTGDGIDSIADFEDGLDVIRFDDPTISFSDLAITDVGGDAHIAYGRGDEIIVEGAAGLIGEDDFVFEIV